MEINLIRPEIKKIADNLDKLKFCFPAFADYSFEGGNTILSFYINAGVVSSMLMVKENKIDLSSDEKEYLNIAYFAYMYDRDKKLEAIKHQFLENMDLGF